MPRSFPKEASSKDIKSGGIALAADLVLKNRFNEARRVLAKLLELCPNDAEVMILLGNVYWHRLARNPDAARTSKSVKLWESAPIAIVPFPAADGC